MKFSYNWLCELAGVRALDAAAMGRLITVHTAECEGVEPWGAHFAEVRAARVVSVEPMAGHHRKAVIDTGSGTRTVVCGAPNCREGIVSAWVPPGTALGSRHIETADVGGVTSEGMLASGAELGISRDHAGIVEIEAAPGEPIPGCRPDSIIEIDNKSLTHRPDLWGHHGMAREVAALAGGQLQEPADTGRIPSGAPLVRVRIEDYALCPRYSALVFENVTVGPSPLWLQARLESLGLNPINNIVDVTNYVMAELAQPMHAFDAAKLAGGTIFVRPARDGETCAALNGETYTLNPSNLVIADGSGAVAIAGVIGGMESSITGATTRIVLESANFHAAGIRKTSSRLKLRTDASMRFEKSQDPANTVRALARAIALLEQVSPGIRLAGGLADDARPAAEPIVLELPLEWLGRKLGATVEPERVRAILEALRFEVSSIGEGVLRVTVPSWRATKDITIKDDLVEEVGRMIGYSSITPTPPRVATAPPRVNERRGFHHAVRQAVAAQGFNEVYNYSFVSEQEMARFGRNPGDHLAVTNPIAAGQGHLRISLLPGLHRNIVENAKHAVSFRLFEIGYEIHKGAEVRETPHMAAAIYAKDSGEQSLFELKRLALGLMPGSETSPCEARAHEHPARVAEVRWKGSVVGRLFELHPRLVEAGRAAVLDLDLAVVESLREETRKYKPVRRFPASEFDLSVVADARDLSATIEARIREHGGSHLENIEFLRVFTGPPLPEGCKSLSYRLTMAASGHTLSGPELTGIREKLLEGLRAAGYELRA
ncbi:MAG: phenylalanine--tRNA ligase subunit beta [Acidobacteria bacterium]|nr:phenylalanine--tRNA ligase subunit beta [Acidobacteriota bacterium]